LKTAAFCVSIFLALCVATVAQDSSYYRAIEKGAATPVQPNQFKQMEQDALKDYSHAENYERLRNPPAKWNPHHVVITDQPSRIVNSTARFP